MDAALIIGSALLSGLVGVWLGARQQERERLGAHLSEYGAALDALVDELRVIPPAGKTAAMIGELLERRLPTLDFYFGRLAKATLARATYFEVERLRLATNNLILSAPTPVLSQLERISKHLQIWADREPGWFAEIRLLRDELARLSREAVARRRFNRTVGAGAWVRARWPQAAAIGAEERLRLDQPGAERAPRADAESGAST